MRSSRLLSALCLGLLLVSVPAMAQKKAPKKKPGNPAMAPVEDVEGLPRVLLVGDSISIGYTVPTREALKGKANVHRPRTNCGPTTRGLEGIDEWLKTGGEGKQWDIIHFNWGLHDLKYLGPNGENLANPKDAKSHQQVPPDEYRKNLSKLVKTLQGTGAHLIWRNTTPVPEGAKGRVVGDSKKYNEIAAEVMKAAGIETHDLFSLVQKHKDDPSFVRKADVHYTAAGSKALGEDVARVVLETLAKK